MVKITNGVNTYEVTRGAFDGIYSRQGYTIVNEKKTQKAAKPQTSTKTDDELFLEDVQEKPIGQWNKDEVKRFATLKKIDLAGTKSVAEAKELVKAFLEAVE